MFTVEIKINGQLVVVVSGINTGTYIEDKEQVQILLPEERPYLYRYSVFNVGLREEVKGSVYHKQKDGIVSLVSKILERAKGKDGW